MRAPQAPLDLPRVFGGGLLGLGLVTAAAYGLVRLLTRGPPNVFVSYSHDDDQRFRNLLMAWAANKKFEFDMELTSPTVAIDSKEAGPVKTELTKRMKAADVLLVIVGENTAHSDWVNWEIERAVQSDVAIPLAGIKVNSRHHLPDGLRCGAAAWRPKFTVDSVESVLKEALP